jgi:Ca2+:H+ antiporter
VTLVTTLLRDLRRFLLGSWLNALLVFIPISVLMAWTNKPAPWVFGVTALAIVPLAGLIGQATEATAEHTGPGIGGLLNATFGNATELIIALFAMQSGLYGVVKASISGSILGNMLLVLGLSMFAGGWGRERQEFNRTTAGAATSMLMLALTALVMPALWTLTVHGNLAHGDPTVQRLSLLTSLVLLAIYVASLVFSLFTHRDLFACAVETPPAERHSPLSSAVALLLIATVLTAVEAELLVHAIHEAAASVGMTELFIGVIVVALVGNAAEHSTAILVARKGQMDLAFHIAIGSSAQIALLVAPLLVVVSFLFGRPMDLVFSPMEIAALALAVLNVAVACLDGESNWFEGLQLVAVYVVLALAFYFVPAPPPAPHPG